MPAIVGATDQLFQLIYISPDQIKLPISLIFYWFKVYWKSLTTLRNTTISPLNRKWATYGSKMAAILCNFMGTCEPFQRETVTAAAKNINSLTVFGWNLTSQGKGITFEQLSETTTHKGDPWRGSGSRKDASCQFCVAGRRGWAQVCSSTYRSLAWVNKEKTGAIWQTCQAWNSLLMFTPFTLELLQCCLSPDFWQGPTVICFWWKRTNNSSSVPHKTQFPQGLVL